MKENGIEKEIETLEQEKHKFTYNVPYQQIRTAKIEVLKRWLAERKEMEQTLRIAQQDIRSRSQKQTFCEKQLKAFKLENTLLRRSTDIRIIEKDRQLAEKDAEIDKWKDLSTEKGTDYALAEKDAEIKRLEERIDMSLVPELEYKRSRIEQLEDKVQDLIRLGG